MMAEIYLLRAVRDFKVHSADWRDDNERNLVSSGKNSSVVGADLTSSKQIFLEPRRLRNLGTLFAVSPLLAILSAPTTRPYIRERSWQIVKGFLTDSSNIIMLK